MSKKPRRNRQTPVVFTPEVQGLLSQVPQEERDTGVLKRSAIPEQEKDWTPTEIEQTVRLGQARLTTSNLEPCRGNFSADDSDEA